MDFFELSVALKYLSPRWRQLSVSIISLISVLVISLVVWLIVVFFSVTHGLEKNWIQKLIALTAPIRITPTQAYYDSYYYQIDSLSANSNYSYKSIREKLASAESDPYDPTIDEEIPAYWPFPVLDETHQLKDLTKIAYEEISKIQGVTAQDYEMTFANVRLRLLREQPKKYAGNVSNGSTQNQSFLNQNAYLGTFDPTSNTLTAAILPLSNQDVTNLLNTLSISSDNAKEDNPETILRLTGSLATAKYHRFFDNAAITSLKSPAGGWNLPRNILPSGCHLETCLVVDGNRVKKVIIPAQTKHLDSIRQELESLGKATKIATVAIEDQRLFVLDEKGLKRELSQGIPLVLEGNLAFAASYDQTKAHRAEQGKDIPFQVKIPVQNTEFVGVVPYDGLEVAAAELKTDYAETLTAEPYWLYHKKTAQGGHSYVLPSDPDLGESILLPKSFRDAGVLVGDTGYLGYQTATASSVQEQRIPIVVAGFYDPGIMPLGGKFVLTNHDVTSLVRSAQNQDDTTLSNGINVRFDDLSRAEDIKNKLQKAFNAAGIGDFWKIETYRDFEFTKDIIQQLHSEKNLFSLLATVIIIVACSNIISMLIILVNDKKLEIGILRSMGASSASIALIFGTCGVLMGLVGSFLGIALAFFTLKNLQSLVGLLSNMQGHEMFNPAFYGETLPTDLSLEALGFVMIMTVVISALAGIVPAIKACLLRPSEILRSE